MLPASCFARRNDSGVESSFVHTSDRNGRPPAASEPQAGASRAAVPGSGRYSLTPSRSCSQPLAHTSAAVAHPAPRSCDWGSFITRYNPLLRSAARGSLERAGVKLTEDQLQDMMQEIYCHLLAQDGRRLLTVSACSEGVRRSFLRRMTGRVVVDQLRRAAADKRGAARLESGKREFGIDDLLEEIPCLGPTPEEYTLMREWLRRFRGHCRELAEGPRGARNVRILLLYLVGGYTSREIARREPGALTAASIDSIVSRLRRRLERNGFRLPAVVRPRRRKADRAAGATGL